MAQDSADVDRLSERLAEGSDRDAEEIDREADAIDIEPPTEADSESLDEDWEESPAHQDY